MRSFIVLCFVFTGLLYGASTSSEIKKSEKNLSETSSAKKQANRKLSKIAKDIKSAQKDIVYLEKKIVDLEKDQVKTEKQYEVLKVELKKSEKELSQTANELQDKAKVFISLLSEQFSIVFAMEHSHAPTQKSILSHEVYSAYKKQNAKVLSTLKSDILALKKRKKKKEELRNKRQNEIENIVKKRENYAQQKLTKEKLRKKLSVDEEKYNAKLEKIEDKQNSLRATLEKLNILHTKEVEEARKRAAARKKAMRLEKERQRKAREAKVLARAKARKAKEALKKATTKEEKAQARLAAKEAEVEEKKVYKEYIALVNGTVKVALDINEKLLVDLPSSKIRIKVHVHEDGKDSFTRIEPISYDEKNDVTLVKAIPKTGRQHQIRVHLFHVEHSIIGDTLYGLDENLAEEYLDGLMSSEKSTELTRAKRLLLHASRISFTYKDVKYDIESKTDIKKEFYENCKF